MLAEGFPNMLMVLGPHTARGNIPRSIEHSVEWQTGLLRLHARARLHARRDRGPSTWRSGRRPSIKAAEGLLSSEVNSWQTGVNRNVEGRKVRRVLGYNGGAVEYRKRTGDVAAGGYRELMFDAGR